MKKTRLAIVAAFLLVNGVALTHAEAEIQLGESVVRPGYVEVNQLRETKEVIVIDKKQLESSNYESIEEVLMSVPEINVGKTGWGEIDIRGQGVDQAAKNVQVLLDGAPITSLTSHPYQNNYKYIPVQNIDKIEIIPGGGSVMYGSGASGGVINITTNLKNISKPVNSLSFTKASNENTYGLGLGAKLKDNFSYQLNYTKSHKDLYFKDTYHNSEYVAFGAAYEPTKDSRLTLRYSHLQEDGQQVKTIQYDKFMALGKDYVPFNTNITVVENGKEVKKKVPSYLVTDRHMNMLSFNYAKNFDENHRLSVDLFNIHGDYYNNKPGEAPMKQKTAGVKAKYDISYGKDSANDLLIGLDIVRQHNTLTYEKYGSSYLFDYDRRIKAIYLYNTFNWDKWAFTQGIRYEQGDWGFEKQEKRSEGKDKKVTSHTIGSLGVSYHYRPTGRIYAFAETGFTYPDGIQVADTVGDKVFASKAKDETFKNYEIGWNDVIGKTNVSVVGFYSVTDNEIRRFYLGGDYISRNIYNVTRKGVSVNASHHFDKWDLKVGYTALKGERRHTIEGEKILAELKATGYDWDDYLPGVPRNKWVIQAQYHPNENLTFTAGYDFYGSYLMNVNKKDRENNEIKGYGLFNFDIGYDKQNGFSAHAGVRNLFNKRFAYLRVISRGSSYSIVPGDERSYYASVSYKF